MEFKHTTRVSGEFLILLLILFLLPPCITVSANPVINEIMYNPLQSDYYNEWVELYNPKNYSINLTNWTLCGDALLPGYVNHGDGEIYLNTSVTIPAGGYAIITDGSSGTDVYGNFNVNLNSFAFHVNSPSICGGLENSGETITLNGNNNLIDSVNYAGYTSYANGNNKTLERINLTGIFAESASFGGTPGFENSVVMTNQSNTANETANETQNQTQSKPGIQLTLNQDYLEINENLTVTINLAGNAAGNLSVKIKRNAQDDWLEEIFSQDNITCFSGSITWKVPGNAISGKYKVYARFEYPETHTSSTKYFNVSGFEDLGEPNLTIISFRENAEFGDYKFVLVKFNSNNYDFPVLRFVSYVNKYVNNDGNETKKYISMDLNKKTISSKFYDSNTVVKLSNISRGETFYLALPLLLKWNCDGDLSDGEYRGTARAYENTGDYIEQKFNITVSGKNKELCEKEIKYIEQEMLLSNTGMVISGEIKMEILNTSDETRIGEELTTRLRITNTGDGNINEIKIYSYIYKGSMLLSSGFNDVSGKWMGGWTANQEVLNLEEGKSVDVALKNKVKEDAETGTYDFKVRAKIGVKDYDIKREILVLEKEEGLKETVEINETKNDTGNLNETHAAQEDWDMVVPDKIKLKILNAPAEIETSGEFITILNLTNTCEENINEIKIYCYAYDGNKVVSLGFNEERGEWMGGWTANQKVLNVSRGKAEVIELRTKIKDDTEAKEYDFKVRVKIGNNDYDLKREINVTEKVSNISITVDERETTSEAEIENKPEEENVVQQEIYETANYDLKPYFLLIILILAGIVFVYKLRENKKKD
ncbi:hypothetical protein BEH94_05890 [Candidatus Altiarchaeales archaeon WOR_SM1_SCG]|nr:hypothetical protein BEH94_05890 [Candidatus Altiarchaeales archaeon WOR_SM1_SCG]